jgi:hypothetical protein
MSAFDDFSEGCMADAFDIIGTETFTLSGIAGRTYSGVLNEFASEKEINLGGISGVYIATLVCQLDQFDDIDGKLERRFDGMSVTVNGRTFKVSRTALDKISITLGLQHPNR